MFETDTHTPSQTFPQGETRIPTVSQLTRSLRGHIESTYFEVMVRGEVSNFRRPASGHGYFVLKDANAQLRSVIFRNSLSRLRFDLNDGMEVILQGKLTVYEARGEYQIVCHSVEPQGVGALQLAYEQLKQKLQKEGLFDPKSKKHLPFLPRRIGVVTSGTGAAFRDILKVFERRYPNHHVILIPASVQGEKAAGEISHSIGWAEKWNKQNPAKPIEVLIVGRGGGSLEDLWPFNEEAVARAIYQCSIPIVSAVGHEIDYTISDFVADVRAATPTAAAEIIMPSAAELLALLENLNRRLAAPITSHLEQLKLHVEHLGRRLIDPREELADYRNQLAEKTERLFASMRRLLEKYRSYTKAQMQTLDALSPLAVLARGYSITKKADGSILYRTAQAKKDEVLSIRLHDGSLHAKVLSKKHQNEIK